MSRGTLSRPACGGAQARLARQGLLRPYGNRNQPFRHTRTFRTAAPHAVPAAAPAPQPAQAADPNHQQHAEELQELDDRLSNRPLALDPAGYFIIKVDRGARLIVAEHYSNAINDKGLAVDEETGEVIGCRGGSVRLPRHVFSGRSAKELSVAVLEPQAADTPQPLPWCSRLEHANYLGREFVRAEMALLSGAEYVQD